MTAPAVVFALLAATAAAAAYHLLFGRSLRQLPLFWLAGVIGFGIAQVAGPMLSLDVPHIGTLRIVEGLIFGVTLMTVVKAMRL